MSAAIAGADGLAVGYDGVPALSAVTFGVAPGSRIGVLGPNGGGKSTLFRALLGELPPLRGTIERPARCGYVPQTERSRLDYPVSALDVALMGTLSTLDWWRWPGRRERERAARALRAVGLQDRADVTYGELSGGQRQRVLVARALVQDAPVLLLDEPFAGVDAPSEELIMTLIDRLAGEGRAVLVATHDVDQARTWDLVLCLNRTQVAFGPPAEVLTREAIERTYGASIVALPGEGGPTAGILPAHHHRHG